MILYIFVISYDVIFVRLDRYKVGNSAADWSPNLSPIQEVKK